MEWSPFQAQLLSTAFWNVLHSLSLSSFARTTDSLWSIRYLRNQRCICLSFTGFSNVWSSFHGCELQQKQSLDCQNKYSNTSVFILRCRVYLSIESTKIPLGSVKVALQTCRYRSVVSRWLSQTEWLQLELKSYSVFVLDEQWGP